MIKNITMSLLLSATSVCVVAADAYVVTKGDTLYSIAARHGISVENLISYNALSSSGIHAGQRLNIPSATVSAVKPVAPVANNDGTYVVRKGDSLSAIAQRHRISLAALRNHNGLGNSVIQAGQTLSIPGKSAGSASVARSPLPVSAPVASAANLHTVKRGETLSGIASTYGIGLSVLARHNNLSAGKPIQAGQRLRIPAGGAEQLAAVKNYSARPVLIKNAGRDVRLESSSAIVVDAETGKIIYAKNADQVRSIASITKLMTAMVALDANLPLDETLTITDGDVDYLKRTTSRLPLGTELSRYEMLRLALMSSENRAASALSRHYPGGKAAFIQAMNDKAKLLGMHNTSFSDATGLTPKNVSTAEDLVKMVEAASHYNLIHQFTTTEGQQVALRSRSAPLEYKNSNALVRNGHWNIEVSKTGYINEAGRCLVMKAAVGQRPAVMVLLDSNGKYSPVGDATRIKNWIESGAANARLAAL